MYFILLNLLFFNIQLIKTQNIIIPVENFNVTFGHIWDKRNDLVTIYFDISNSTFNQYRYYYFDFRPFASQDQIEYFPRQRLTDTHNSLHVFGLHEADYVSCISLIDEYENIFKLRSTCYEFTIGEKIVGSHHGGSTGYLAPLLLAFAFVIHVFIAIVHHIKAKDYGHKLLQRFIDVNPKTTKRIENVKHSLKQLDLPRVSASVQRRLSRVSIGTDENNHSNMNRKISLGIMKSIPEYYS